jgi:hypothetical protein
MFYCLSVMRNEMTQHCVIPKMFLWYVCSLYRMFLNISSYFVKKTPDIWTRVSHIM